MKMKFTIILMVTYGIAVAQCKIDREHFINLLNSGSYDQAYAELIAIQKQPLGKCCLTDYLIGKSLCLSGYPESAKSRYENILNNYKQLPTKTKEFIEHEVNDCQPNTLLAEQESNNIKVFPNEPAAGVRGKLGIVYNCYQKYEAVHVVKDIPDEEFNSRIFSLSQKNEAVKKIQSLVPSNYAVFAKDNFILAINKGPDTTKVKRESVINELVKTLHFYSSYYSLRLPDKLITAYIVPNNTSLQIIAGKVHGITVPKENYGYSSLGDLSILGISNSIGTGTLKHELFHIVVRGDIGDIPAWLDEGIATLYEESHWVNDTVLVNNDIFWRTKVLEQTLTGFHLYSKLPALRTLINYSWTQFESSDKGDICAASVNYAFAKHFVVYLEQTNQLRKILNAYKDKRSDDKETLIKTNSEILEEACGITIDSLERAFNNWLIKTYRLSFLDPTSNHGLWEENEGISVIVDFKRDISEAKTIYDSLLKAKDSSNSLLAQITKNEALYEANSDKFEADMRELYAHNHGQIEIESRSAYPMYQFIRNIREIDMNLKNTLTPYKK